MNRGPSADGSNEVRRPKRTMKVVSIGGGTGLSTLLRGLKHHVHEATRPAHFKPSISRLTAVVTVTDEGGSSGRLRSEFGILPPGDIRNCLVALAEDEELFTRIFSYRFSSGRGLRGHSLGNLLLAALSDLTSDFAMAVKVSSEVLAIRGEIYPSTLADVRLRARLRDGRKVAGESRISSTRVPIERLEIVPRRCRPLPETLAAILEADLITLGPGSLYTSLIPNLLVHGIPQVISLARARKVYISNLMTQPGETSRYTAADHLRALNEHAGSRLFDHVVVNTQPLSPRLARKYAAQRAEPVAYDLKEIRSLGAKPVRAKLLAEDGVARHDPRRLARLVLSLAKEN
jgi:uncharacterized cofD-like protein